MDREINGKLEDLMASIILLRDDEQAKTCVPCGERIIELVKEGDYREAKFCMESFAYIVNHSFREMPNKVTLDYIQNVVDLIDSLP
jgi:hypothetical protein